MWHKYFSAVLVLLFASCSTELPSYDEQKNPFNPNFTGEYLEVVDVVKGYSQVARQTQYTVKIKPNYNLIHDEVFTIYVNAEGRPNDQFYLGLGMPDARNEVVTFVDQLVRVGELNYYTFYLMYKGKESIPNKQVLEIYAEP